MNVRFRRIWERDEIIRQYPKDSRFISTPKFMGTRYYYICVNNRTAGIVGLNIKKTEIIHLYIKPRYRGKGISRQAVKLLEITLRTYEKRGAGVFIRKDNVLGKKFWKSLGYTYKEPSKKGRAVLYVKSF